MTEWNPDIEVRLLDQPDRTGRPTGRIRRAGSIEYVEVRFTPTKVEWVPEDSIEHVPSETDPVEDLLRGICAGVDALARTLTLERIGSNLTTILYSMEASNTEFFAHQFKPVLKFIESADRRILIADEVGLGKTVEALYIWREMEIRDDARRLLVVCPAKLCPKWLLDMKRRFGIEGEQVDAAQLLDLLREPNRPGSRPRHYVVSLDSIRAQPSQNGGGDARTPAKVALQDLLEEYVPADAPPPIDLLVVDEAHYLRNPATASHGVAARLSGCSRGVILLSATPIQNKTDDLATLMSLIDPDRFGAAWRFRSALEEHRHYVRAQRAMWKTPPNLKEAALAVSAIVAEQSGLARREPDSRLRTLQMRLVQGPDPVTTPERVAACQLLDALSPLGSVVCRSLKRHVYRQRVIRSSQSPSIQLTQVELETYEDLSQQILIDAFRRDHSSVAHLMLITRQKQLGSSLVATLEGWEDNGFLGELLDESGADDEFSIDAFESEPVDLTPPNRFRALIPLLRRGDSKYNALRGCMTDTRIDDPSEKIIVFSYFRTTIRYLRERLLADGESVFVIQGAGPGERATVESRQRVLQDFEMFRGPCVLVSSEVGSEGIDLQFCRIVVNYDLPWNPMRVEQRIGRVDRIGQMASRISVVNLVCVGTVEERVVTRLYQKLNIFQESIGDLEEILGERVEKMIVDSLRPGLTEEERESQIRSDELALENIVATERELETNAAVLSGHTDYLLDKLQAKHDAGDCILPTELRAFVLDFVRSQFKPVVASPVEPGTGLLVQLPPEGYRAFQEYLRRSPSGVPTRMDRPRDEPTLLVFDPRAALPGDRPAEAVNVGHPFISWIRQAHESNPRGSQVVVRAVVSTTSLPRGRCYLIVGAHSLLQGMRRRSELLFSAVDVETGETLAGPAAQDLVFAAARTGRDPKTPMRANPQRLRAAIAAAEERLWEDFTAKIDVFKTENTALVAELISGVERSTRRRVVQTQAKLDATIWGVGSGDKRAEQRRRALKGQITRLEKSGTESVNRIERAGNTKAPILRQIVLGLIEIH
jgi:superfamily II DNA or RNA helicase